MLGFGPLAAHALAALPGGASNVTLTASARSFAFTGIASAFKVTLTGTVRTYALTGIADAFRVTMAEAAGAYTETGPATLFRVSLATVVGTYTLTGQGAIFAAGTLSAGVGAYILTGQAITFFYDQRGITDTDILLLPVDCVLAGQQTIVDRYRTWEKPAYKRTEKIGATRSGVGEISNYGGRPGALRHAFNE